MPEELSPEQIAEIRAATLILCDKVLEQRAELETLRGIAKRLADGWQNHWEMQTREYLWFHTEDGEMEPMTPGEVQAIYGQKEDDDAGS